MLNRENRRNFWRAAFHAPARLIDSAGTAHGEVLDISLKGVLLKMPATWHGKDGERCQFHLALADDVSISMWATVAHLEGQFAGLHCDKIDVDSMTHLRRLVELNSGDPKLLERELPALLAEA